MKWYGPIGGRDFNPDKELCLIGVSAPEASGAEALSVAELKLGPPNGKHF